MLSPACSRRFQTYAQSIFLLKKKALKQGIFAGTVALTTAAVSGWTMPAQAATVLAGPTNSQFAIGSLRDGNYRFCSDRPAADVGPVTGACFRFRKRGDRITGDYYYPNKGESLCLSGRVNGNTISGRAIERLDRGENLPLSELPELPLESWKSAGFLQVGQGIYVDDLNRPDAIRYQSALLNLNNFYQYNAGLVLPPVNCPTRINRIISTTPNPDALVEVGTSPYYQQPVYLDSTSVTEVAADTYRYTTLVGLPNRLSESEYELNCNRLDAVTALRSRYYDRDGDLQELEIINQPVPLGQDASFNEQQRNVVQQVCGQTVQAAVPTAEDVSYQRYRNDRFNYSLLYPEEYLVSQGATANSTEQVFQSSDGSVVLRTYAEEQGEASLAQRYEQAQSDRSVTYRIIEDDDFFVVSGNDSGNVFYQKTILEEGTFKTLMLQYPLALRTEFDAIARTIADSFATTELGTGIRQLPEAVQTAVLEQAAKDTEDPSAVFEVVLAEEETWPDGCLGLSKPDELCTQALVDGWRVQIEAEVTGVVRSLVYRTNATGSQVRFDPRFDSQ